MNRPRRSFLKTALAAALGLIPPLESFAAWQPERFKPGPLEASLKQSFGNRPIAESREIEITLPLIAENGALVPITVRSALPGVRRIALFVAKNPIPLAAEFELSPDLAPFVSARLKMAETSHVIAVVESGGKLYSAGQLVKVTIGGCGG